MNRPRAAASLAALGLLTATAIVCGAVVLRDPATVTTLEQDPVVTRRPATPAVAVSSGERAAGPAPEPAPASAPEPTTPAPEEPEAPAKTEPARAQPAELESARAEGGSAALGALAQRYPEDPAVLRALALAQGREKGHAAALSTTKRLFELAPEEIGNDEIKQLLLRIANGPPDVALTALDLMAKHMGSRGPDLLYEVMTAPKFGDWIRDNASKLMLDSNVRQLATPALLVADDLRRLTDCPSSALIARAREAGDVRALHYIKAHLTPQRCANSRKRRCLKCASVAKELRAAANVIEKRKNEKAAAASPAASTAR
ncbi:hypothetical protein [Sorangium sp. So ce1024]|uniref:hypothetical protein n=1 Tax=unclassified Sorangium TaxID=2621164 RepID=UPI003F04AA48